MSARTAVSGLVVHPWLPVYDAHSKILILGTILSPKSQADGFYYGNPHNIFWRTLAYAVDQPEPQRDMCSRRDFLLRNKIALWDVLHSCEISGAADSTIKNPTVNCIAPLIEKTQIKTIFTTGRIATELFNKYCAAEAGMTAIYLPSTSPANRAAQSKPEFYKLWRQISNYLYCTPPLSFPCFS